MPRFMNPLFELSRFSNLIDFGTEIKVLFLGDSAGPTAGDDAFVMTHLQNRYGIPNVTYKQDSVSVTADADGMTIIVISASVSSGLSYIP